MNDKSSVAELIWLMRLRQGLFFEPQMTQGAFSEQRPRHIIDTGIGQAESTLSVLNEASEWSHEDAFDA